MTDTSTIDRSRLAWWLVALVLGLVAAYVFYSFIGTFVVGIFLYYSTRPVYRRMKRVLPRRDMAAVTSLLLLALPAILLAAYTLAIGLQELDRLAETTEISQSQLEQLQATLGPYINASSIVSDPQSILTEGNFGTARGVLDSMLEYVGLLGNAALHLFVILALAFYLLRDDHKFSTWFRRRFGDDDGVLEAYLDAVDGDFHSVFFGNILNAVLTGSIGAVSYNVLNIVAPPGLEIPVPSLLGLLTGAASLIPVVGMKLVYFPVSAFLAGEILLADPQYLWFAGLFFVVSFVIVDTIPDLVLRPYVSGRNLHVGMIMLAYILGPLLFGWFGIFLGPMILVLLVHFARIILPELLAGEAIRPWAVEETQSGEEDADSDRADLETDEEDEAPEGMPVDAEGADVVEGRNEVDDADRSGTATDQG